MAYTPVAGKGKKSFYRDDILAIISRFQSNIHTVYFAISEVNEELCFQLNRLTVHECETSAMNNEYLQNCYLFLCFRYLFGKVLSYDKKE